MKLTQLPKALLILFLIIIASVGVFYFMAPPTVFTKFDTSYANYPDPLPTLHDNPENVIEVPGLIRTFDVTQAGDKIAIATSGEIIIYKLDSLEKIHSYPVHGQIAKILFSPDGSKLALSGADRDHYQSGSLNIAVIDADTSASLYHQQNDPSYYYSGSFAWSPDSKQIAYPILENSLSIIDVATGETKAVLNDFSATPSDISWSPDGSRILAPGGYGNGIHRWRLDTNQWVRLWDARLQPASQVRWSPDGNKIATGHYGGMICIWNAKNNSCEGTIQAHYNRVGALDWSPDSTQVASASGAIRIWDVSNGEMKSAFGYGEDIVYDQLQWFDPQTIATLETSYTLDVPTTIRFWGVSTGDVKLVFRGWENMHSGNTGGVMLVMDDIRIGLDRTEFAVSLWFDKPEISIARNWNLTMTDSQGRIYPLTDITPSGMNYSVERIYQTVPLQAGESIALNLVSFPLQNGISMMVDVSAFPGRFAFHPGILEVSQFMPQKIKIDANGWFLRLTNIQQTDPNELAFEFETEGIYEGVLLYAPQASRSTDEPLDNEKIMALLAFSQIPNETIEVEVQGITYFNPGSWTLNFYTTKSMFAELSPVKEVEPNPASAPERVFTSQDPFFIEVKTLTDKFDRSIIQKGWVHVTNEVISENIQPRYNYPPPYYKEEQWYEVDAEGWVLRALITHFDKDGNIIQQNVWVGTHALNITTGGAGELLAYKLSLDQTLSAFDYALNNGHAVVREDTLCDDGSPCLLIKMRDGAFARHVWINAETGQLVKLQALEYAADETEIIQFTQIFLSVEWTSTPPQEVLEVFEKILFPIP